MIEFPSAPPNWSFGMVEIATRLAQECRANHKSPDWVRENGWDGYTPIADVWFNNLPASRQGEWWATTTPESHRIECEYIASLIEFYDAEKKE